MKKRWRVKKRWKGRNQRGRGRRGTTNLFLGMTLYEKIHVTSHIMSDSVHNISETVMLIRITITETEWTEKRNKRRM